MPFGVESGVGRWMGVLDGSGDLRREGAILGVNLGHPIVTNRILCVRGGNDAFPKLLWDFLSSIIYGNEKRSRDLEQSPLGVISDSVQT